MGSLPGGVTLGFAAGVFSTLSPCVLPILPLILGAAVAAHRYGAAALAAGLAVSFVAIGMFVATVGFAIGLDSDLFRAVSAVVLALFGLALLSGAAGRVFARVTGAAGTAGHRLMARIGPTGLGGQALLGVLLGAAWTPCVGPTLGAASLLAAQGRDLGAVAAVMLAFGIGAATPLLLLGMLSRAAILRWRGRMLEAGRTGRTVLGAGAIAVAALILTGSDHAIETALVSVTPGWLTDLTTRF
jgi:cytochrome c biogenesis protein CcdA